MDVDDDDSGDDDDYSGDDVYVPAVVKVAISSLSIPPPSDSKGLGSAFWMCFWCF